MHKGKSYLKMLPLKNNNWVLSHVIIFWFNFAMLQLMEVVFSSILIVIFLCRIFCFYPASVAESGGKQGFCCHPAANTRLSRRLCLNGFIEGLHWKKATIQKMNCAKFEFFFYDFKSTHVSVDFSVSSSVTIWSNSVRGSRPDMENNMHIQWLVLFIFQVCVSFWLFSSKALICGRGRWY